MLRKSFNSTTQESLLDERDRAPNRLVLEWAIEQARKRRDRVLFVQLHPMPGSAKNGQPCLHANDARGARFWLPMDSLSYAVIQESLADLQRHIGKPIAVFPHGALVAYLRHTPSTAEIQLCPQAYGLPTTGLRFFTVYGPWDRPDMALQKFAQAMRLPSIRCTGVALGCVRFVARALKRSPLRCLLPSQETLVGWLPAKAI